MPRIFDNIEQSLLSTLKDTIRLSERADFCVGYFNLRGWRLIESLIEEWSGGEGACCRLLVGMNSNPQDEIKTAYSLIQRDDLIDQATVLRLRKQAAEQFKKQLEFGAPSSQDNSALRRLRGQLRDKKVVVKLFLRHNLHAKLYLLHRADPNNPTVGFVGSSNLTLAGLSKQGELNVDVLDHDACKKLQKWFEDRWNDNRCVDITDELIEIIDNSWVTERKPYYIYLKMAYHLSQEARAGLSEFKIPRDFKYKLFDYQNAAVKIAAHHLNKRGGVLLGDVVGLGKTMMATALARIFADDYGWSTLIICPKNLTKMWQSYVDTYGLHARVMSLSKVIKDLPDVPARFRIVLIDESHNLRNREGKRFRAIHEYIRLSDSKCILLSATPYNKTYQDLAAQLRLFVPEDLDLGIRPERKLAQMGELEFLQRHQCPVRSLAAFEKSEYADDWRELMRLYLVRRTRSFIQSNYAKTDESGRKYLKFEDGSRSYFPARTPRTIKFVIDDASKNDPYAKLSSRPFVQTIEKLALPRYGLGNYIAALPEPPASPTEVRALADLSRAGKRLMGFCRTNLFKRLESGGPAFIQSIERHILRNFVFLHAIETNQYIPIGSQSAEFLDSRTSDRDADGLLAPLFDEDGEENDDLTEEETPVIYTEADFRSRAAQIYEVYRTKYRTRFRWIRASLFDQTLTRNLAADAGALINLIKSCGAWDAARDEKLKALLDLLLFKHPDEKVLIFTQFADTVEYLVPQLERNGVSTLAGATGSSNDPTELAWRFSPESNNKRNDIKPEDELRVLVATDILSEGQNLQDAHIVVNYDLPWAIIRLIQRAGRVDRIGQKAEEITCYSFLPADGVERIINLRSRVTQRLRENAEVVGADEAFFEDEANTQNLVDLYNEKSGILDGEPDSEVDLASYAYQIWKDASDKDKHIVEALPNVVNGTRKYAESKERPEGVLVYMRTSEENDALAWIDKKGNSVTQSQLAILQAAECSPDEEPNPNHELHHELVEKGVQHLVEETASVGGQLGRPSSARSRTFHRLKTYSDSVKDMSSAPRLLDQAIQEIYEYPLKQSAIDTLNRQLKSGIEDTDLVHMVLHLREDDNLCLISEDAKRQEPQIICSMGLFASAGE